jgi:hypothetical protein
MSRAPLSFKRRDMMRAIKAAQDAGLNISGIDVAKGTILIGDPVDNPKAVGVDSWAQAIAELESRQ